MKWHLLTLVLFGVVACLSAIAQSTRPVACGSETIATPAGYPADGCAPNVNNLSPGQFQAKPFIDDCTGTNCDHYGDPDGNIERLYGTYGNDEYLGGNNGLASTHYTEGTDLSSQIQPLCTDGSTSTTCPDGYPKAIVVLFLGLSNCTIEVCGGNSDAFDPQRTMTVPPLSRLAGQPCATGCPNLVNGGSSTPWNTASDFVNQQSFLFQVYEPATSLAGQHVALFDGAKGMRTLEYWDPTTNGYWANQSGCDDDPFMGVDPECEYYRVAALLTSHHYSEKQVQVVYLRSADAMPQCDLKGTYCNTSITTTPDAYRQEVYLGNILRYLKCCTLNSSHQSTGNPRYANLKQVFVTSQTYDGYANGQTPYTSCLLPEPFAYEGGFAVQRLIVDQIKGVDDGHTGMVDYKTDGTGHAPWVDWGPYLWISGETQRSDLLRWCGGQQDSLCNGTSDVRNGDSTDQADFPGDWTHPTAQGLAKVASQLVTFFTQPTSQGGSPFVQNWNQR